MSGLLFLFLVLAVDHFNASGWFIVWGLLFLVFSDTLTVKIKKGD